MSDYRWLARKLAGILVEADGAVGEGQPDSR
jgi:hypothetical protein